MDSAEVQQARPVGFRRARREDIELLLPLTAAPEPGRVRALRRLLKSLAADVYLHFEGSTATGCVAVVYRRSLAAGGLVATIDMLAALPAAPDAAAEHRSLVQYAVYRARRRGCVSIDGALEGPAAKAAQDAGLRPAGQQWATTLRPQGEKGEP